MLTDTNRGVTRFREAFYADILTVIHPPRTSSDSCQFPSFSMDRLGVGDRLELIEQIWNGLPDQVDPSEIPAWSLVELAKCRQGAEERSGIGDALAGGYGIA
jgi:hypothetical protein